MGHHDSITLKITVDVQAVEQLCEQEHTGSEQVNKRTANTGCPTELTTLTPARLRVIWLFAHDPLRHHTYFVMTTQTVVLPRSAELLFYADRLIRAAVHTFPAIIMTAERTNCARVSFGTKCQDWSTLISFSARARSVYSPSTNDSRL